MVLSDQKWERVANLLGDLQYQWRVEACEEKRTQAAVGVTVARPDGRILAKAQQALKGLRREEVIDHHNVGAALKVAALDLAAIPGRRQSTCDPRRVCNMNQSAECSPDRALVLTRQRRPRDAQAGQPIKSNFVVRNRFVQRHGHSLAT